MRQLALIAAAGAEHRARRLQLGADNLVIR